MSKQNPRRLDAEFLSNPRGIIVPKLVGVPLVGPPPFSGGFDFSCDGIGHRPSFFAAAFDRTAIGVRRVPIMRLSYRIRF